MKQKYSRLFGVLALIASASILFGCKQNISTKDNSSPAAVKITVTVQGDEQVIVQEPKTFQVDKGSVWKTVKEKVKVTYKDGYELLRWNVGNKDGKVLTDEYVFTENTTVFAVSKLEGDYTITYHFDDGINDPSNPASYNVETETITLNPADRTGYTFKGWFDNEACTGDAVTEIKKGSTGDKVFWAKWEAIPYTITYNLNGGTNDLANPASYNIETATIILKGASKENYTFAGWYDNAGFTSEKVSKIEKGSTGNKELWAKWETVSYTITYHLGDGDGHTDNPTSYNIETATITLKNAAKTGYTFEGWFDNENYSGSPVTQIANGSTGNKDFWAKWEVIPYTVTYNLNGGTNDSANPVSYNIETATIILKEASKENYTFAGWYDNAGFTGEKVSKIEKGSTGNKDFWAKWEINTYPVIFSVDGENGALKAKVKESGSEITSGAQVEHGKTVMFTAEPADGYAVEQWMLNGNPVSAVGRNVTYEYAITAKTNVTVQFKKIEKEVGVIVLKDGTYRTKETYRKIDPANPPVAVIAGKLNEKHLGIALHIGKNLRWAKEDSTGHYTKFEDIVCKPSEYGEGSAATSTFSGDTDGSDNWGYIKSIDSAGTADAAKNYPAFNWVQQYNTKYGTNIAWYMPSIAELCEVYKNRDPINVSLEAIHNLSGGSAYADTLLGTDWYWSSSQFSDSNRLAWTVDLDGNKVENCAKYDPCRVCCIAGF